MRTERGLPKAPRRGAAGTALALVFSAALSMLTSASPRIEATPTVNWSGYALGGGNFTAVTGTFNVPAPLGSTSCMEETSIWVGIDGVYNQDLLQAGITESGFTVSTSHTHTSWPTPDVARR